MGCVSSKRAKKEVVFDEKWGAPPLWRRKPFDSIPHDELSLEDCHRHLIALTSSSYGLLKPETPKPARVRSLDNLHDRLDELESMESAPDSWHKVNCNLQTFMPGLHRSISEPVPQSNKSAVQETISVTDIMHGLEEGTYSPWSPSKIVGSSSYKLQAPFFPDTFSARHKMYNKFASFSNTTECSAISHINAGYVAHHEKQALLASHNLSGACTDTVTASSQGRLQNQSQYACITTLQSKDDFQGKYVSNEMAVIPDKPRETVAENTSVLRDQHQESLQLSPRVSYATASRSLKVTLNLEYENTVVAGMHKDCDTCESNGSSARQPTVDNLTNPNSPLFDPALLASYEKAMEELTEEDWRITDDANNLFEKVRLVNDNAFTLHVSQNECCPCGSIEDTSLTTQSVDPLNEFEWRCPPGGAHTIVLYATTLRSVRKTFEDCSNVRRVLKSFSLRFHERDVFMHSEYRNELIELLGGQLLVPSVFIKGRYIGGVDSTINLHEGGKLAALLKGLPQDLSAGTCEGCGDLHFIPCLTCSGRCKLLEQGRSLARCSECNENGLIKCSVCR